MPERSDVSVRDVRPEDLPILCAHQQDAGANVMAAVPARDTADFFDHWDKALQDESVVAKTILSGDCVVGHVTTFVRSGERLVGYWIGREHWGRGIATAALAAFLEVVPLRPLIARVAKHNVASQRVLRKCGFAVCGEQIGTGGIDGADVLEVVHRLD